MAATSLQSLHHPIDRHHHHRHCFSSSVSIRPITSQKPFPTLSSSLATTTTTTASPSLDTIAGHLAAADFRLADEETRRLLIALAGDAAVRRGYVFFSEVQFISAADLRAIDRLWRRHSRGRFGYRAQRRVWEKARRDFTRFFVLIGWMKRIEGSDVEQFNYREFPDEFVWELTDKTPEGHLPLTNALRGTQLLANILMHPAFEEDDEDDDGDDEVGGSGTGVVDNEEKGSEEAKPIVSSSSSNSGGRILKSDYSF